MVLFATFALRFASFASYVNGKAGVFMVVISKKKGESKDTLFRKFTRTFIEEDIMTEVRNKLFYKKPSLIRKEREKERKQDRYRFKLGKRPYDH